jgi:ribonuclease BN (tRNA processing enzyme)
VVDEIGPGELVLGPFAVTAVPVLHTEQSLAYRFEAPDGGTFAISGDSHPCDGLVEVARDADLFVCESAWPEALRKDGHLTPASAGRAAAEAGVRTLCLTHFYPACAEHDLLAEARSAFDGDLVLAEDLMHFDLART